MSQSRVRPSRVRLEATSVCQLHCPDCPTASGKTRAVLKTGHLRIENFRNLLDRDPNLAQVELSNYGELFLNPELLQIIEYAFRRGVRLTADNGANLNTVRPEILEALVKYRFRRITCSIDGASADTYSQYRVGGDFATVISNIRLINRYKEQHRSRYPKLTWQFVVFPHNRHEVDDARLLARQLNMKFYEKLPWKDRASDPSSVELVHIGPAVEPASRGEYLERYGVSYQRSICAQLWRTPQVNWDGRILGCCRNFWGEFGGNAFEQGLEEAVNREPMRYAREMLLGRQPPRQDIPCTTCELYFDMRDQGRWLMPSEIHLPKSILDRLTRLGLRNRLIVGVVGAFCRAAEVGYFLLVRIRRDMRTESTAE